MRTVIVHYHIFKNAGCSVDRILERSFHDRWATLEGTTATSLLRPRDLAGFITGCPRVVAVSSHLLRPPAPPGLDVLPVVLIRHPLDRAFSVYSQLRRNRVGDLLSETVAQQTSFSEFVRWCLEHKSLGGMVIVNYQVIHLSAASFRGGHIYDALATEDDLAQAIGYLADGACFGAVDHFDEVMERLRRAAREAGLHVSDATAAENTTVGRPHDLEERLSIAREELGPSLFARYEQDNELDFHLYEWTCRHQ